MSCITTAPARTSRGGVPLKEKKLFLNKEKKVFEEENVFRRARRTNSYHSLGRDY